MSRRKVSRMSEGFSKSLVSNAGGDESQLTISEESIGTGEQCRCNDKIRGGLAGIVAGSP